MKISFANAHTKSMVLTLAKAQANGGRVTNRSNEAAGLRIQGFMTGAGRGKLRLTASGKRMAELCAKIMNGAR